MIKNIAGSKCVVLLISFFAAIGSLSADSAIDWPNLNISALNIVTYSAPTCIAHAGDGTQRLFIGQKGGTIMVITNNATLQYLNITNRVLNSSEEQGLLGIAFPPGFATNRHFYVAYTRKSDGHLVVSRFQATNNTADPNSEQAIIDFSQPFQNHYGGGIAFGPDGYLYIGKGDGGYTNNYIGDPYTNAQNTASLLGKLLRLDVESGATPYGVPASNPFVGVSNCAPEIWAYGLRNPWRFSFDRQTGDLYIGDVGHFAYEEVDFQPAGSAGGQNYGWRIMEGPTNYMVPAGFTNFASLAPPVTSYPHDYTNTLDGEMAEVGGFCCRPSVTSRLTGIYIYGDYATGELWGLTRSGTNWTNQVLVPYIGGQPHFTISTFGEDDQGNLYLADIGAGRIYKIQDSGKVWAPGIPGSGSVLYSNLLPVSCVSPNAQIYYAASTTATTNSMPVGSNGLVLITNRVQYAFQAFRSGLTPSGNVVATYTLQVGPPLYNPPQGPIASNTPVTINTVTPGATIYYTTNGTQPTNTSSIYTGPIVINGGILVKAYATALGYSNSVISNATYTAAQVASLVFAPASGPIANATPVTITCSTPGAVIYYTTDGSTPSTNSPVYSGPVVINGGMTLSAYGVSAGYVNGSVKSVFYSLVQTAPPVFAPAAGPLTYGSTIGISCGTAGSIIYYTIDGSLPTTNSATYSNSLTITQDFTLKAYATTAEHLDSTTNTVSFKLTSVSAPVFAPTQGPLTNGTLISVGSLTSNATVYYTTDGSIPGTNSQVYSSPVLFTNQMTLKAVAYADQMDSSSVSSTYYSLVAPESDVVVTTFAGSSTAGYADGPLAGARFSGPQAICIDPVGNFYVADTGNKLVRKISADGMVTTIGTNFSYSQPSGVCLDAAGNVYVGDSGNCNRIYRIATNGMAAIYASITTCGAGPYLGQLVSDAAGDLYVGFSTRLHEVLTNGSVLDFGYYNCHCPTSWSVYLGLGIDAQTNVYLVANDSVWLVVPGVSTNLLAGGNSVFSDGLQFQSGFQLAQDAAIDAVTNVFIADSVRIRRIRPDGWVGTVAGTGVPGYVNGRGMVAQIRNAVGLCVDPQGNIYVADAGNNCIRKISFMPADSPALQVTPADAGQLAISWPIWADQFTLEVSGSLDADASWMPMTNGVSAGVNNFVLTNSPAATSLFYRLHKH